MSQNNETNNEFVTLLEKDGIASISGGYADWARRTFVLSSSKNVNDELFRGVGRVFFSDHPQKREDAVIYSIQIDDMARGPIIDGKPVECKEMVARLVESYVAQDQGNLYKNVFVEFSGKMIPLHSLMKEVGDSETLKRIKRKPEQYEKLLPPAEQSIRLFQQAGLAFNKTLDEQFVAEAKTINTLSIKLDFISQTKKSMLSGEDTLEGRKALAELSKQETKAREEQLEAIYILKNIMGRMPDSSRKKEYLAKDSVNVDKIEIGNIAVVNGDLIDNMAHHQKSGRTALHFTMTKKTLAEEFLDSYFRALDNYAEVRQTLKAMPNFSEAVTLSDEQIKDAGTTYLLGGNLKKVSFKCDSGTGLLIPTYKNNINEFLLKKEFAKMPVKDCVTIWRQVTVFEQLTINQLKFLQKNEKELTAVCEKYTADKMQKEQAQAMQAQKEAEAAQAQKEAMQAQKEAAEKIKKQKTDFVKKETVKDGNMFAIKRSPLSIKPQMATEKEAIAKTANTRDSLAKQQRELTKQIYARNKSLEEGFHTGKILYEKIGVSAEFDSLTNKDEVMQAILNGHEPDTYSEYRMVYETPVGTAECGGSKNIEDMYDKTLPSQYKTQLARIPSGFPVWSDFQQGFLDCERLDGTNSIESSMYKNSAIYRFKVDNKDGSNGRFKTTEEMAEALRQGYGYDEMLKDFDNIDKMEKRKHDVSVFLYDKKLGALQAVVWAREQTEGIADVKKYLASLPDVKEDGFSVLGIKVDAKSIEDTIFELTPKREEAISTLLGQIDKMRATSESCKEQIAQTIKLLGEIPPNIAQKARAEFDSAVRGGVINRLEKMQLLKLRMAELKKLWSQIKINGEKLNASGIFRPDNVEVLPNGNKKDAKIG